MNFNGFFFDLDGTLINSMDYHYNSWNKILKNEFNYSLNKEKFMITEGTKLNFLISDFLSEKNIKISKKKLNDLIEMKDEDYRNNNKASFYPNSIKFVKFLKAKKTKISLVTAGSKKRIKWTLSKSFLDLFDCIVTGNDCKLGKPDPEPYLIALKKLKLSPSSCAALENAPLGVESSKSAKIFTYAITNTLKKKDLTMADKIISSFKELM